jgi:hypothetical protein
MPAVTFAFAPDRLVQPVSRLRENCSSESLLDT